MDSCTRVPSAAHLAVLKQVFDITSFRDRQYEAVEATLSKRDSLVILPTGAGKSLTFQLPPHLVENAFTVVIGPLIALMKDQVNKCCDKGIEAAVYNSDCDEARKQKVLRDITCDEPGIKLLYTTPESFRQARFRNALKEAHQLGTLLAFAIDEAHCVSDWGHDFRPAYLELASLREEFPTVPITAVTASCTATVENSIKTLLKLKEPAIIKSSLNRPNIQYLVRHKELLQKDAGQAGDPVLQDLKAFLRSRAGQCGIIYARTRATCDNLTAALNNGDDNMEVGCYHAGKDPAARSRVQNDWCSGAINVVVATIAFGMGIDRADVRWVVHFTPPSSPENFYQESGRAGRDGRPCTSVVYVSASDLYEAQRMEFFSNSKRQGAVDHIEEICRTACCRRKQLLVYYGEKGGSCAEDPSNVPCDYCANPTAVRRCVDALSRQAEGWNMAAAVHARMQGPGGPATEEDNVHEEQDQRGDGARESTTHTCSLAEQMRARFQTAKQMGKGETVAAAVGAGSLLQADGHRQQQPMALQGPAPLQPRWSDMPLPAHPSAIPPPALPPAEPEQAQQRGSITVAGDRYAVTDPAIAAYLPVCVRVPHLHKRNAPAGASEVVASKKLHTSAQHSIAAEGADAIPDVVAPGAGKLYQTGVPCCTSMHGVTGVTLPMAQEQVTLVAAGAAPLQVASVASSSGCVDVGKAKQSSEKKKVAKAFKPPKRVSAGSGSRTG